MRKILDWTRFVVIVPAIASIVGALFLLVEGSIQVVMIAYVSTTTETYAKQTVVDVLTAVDAILLGTVLLVIGYGLYALFVDPKIVVPRSLRVRDLDELKSKLIGVVVAILAVAFVAIYVDADRSADVLAYGLGAGALTSGVALFAWATRKTGARETTRPSRDS